MISAKQQRGLHGQTLAERFLRRQGYRTLQANYHSPFGEIDLIMQDHHYVVFIEVRLRNNPNHGHALETIIARKQQRIIKTALHYLQRHQSTQFPDCRFDAIGIEPPSTITWVKNAFSAQILF